MRTFVAFAALVLVFAHAPRLWCQEELETFRWRGRVDGVDDILIQGDDVRVEHVAARPIQDQDYRFSAPLPSVEVELELRTIRGRGNVRILEQPTRRNDYTAVVRIDDSEPRGDDEYEFELSWSRELPHDGGDVYSGLFRWKGRVDIGCDIEIRGQTHQVKDQGGQGTRERSFEFSEPLPSDGTPVSLRKRDGRGRVELVQAPDSGNDYTAVVRIEDSKGGADDYEFELRWSAR